MIRVRKFATIDELEMFLQGAVFSSRKTNSRYSGIVGTTLIFTQPDTETVTFTTVSDPTDPTSLSYAEVKLQIETVMTGLTVKQKDGRLVLMQTTPTIGQGVEIDAASTSLLILGLSGVEDMGKVYDAPDGATAATVPFLVTAYMSSDNSHVVLTQE